MEPTVQTSTLNEELKNPHLVETLIRVSPLTGKRIETASSTDTMERDLLSILQSKMTGEIPEIEVSFNVQGIPLLLSKQSHLELRLSPRFYQQLSLESVIGTAPLTFEINRAMWPKVNAACISHASATFSNFSVESPAPLLMPYLRYYQMQEDLRTNYSRAWNPSYLENELGVFYRYANRYISSSNTGLFSTPTHRSPYSVAAIRESGAAPIYSWYGEPLLVQIPLEDILPVFQIPVIPLRQTNTSNLNIRLRLRSPRHMFFSAGMFNPTTGCNLQSPAASTIPFFNIDEIAGGDQIDVYVNGQPNTTKLSLQNAIVGGGTVLGLKSFLSNMAIKYTDVKSFYVDFDVDCDLVLHCLTTPLLNPLVQRYIEPFIDELNQFAAHFADYYVFSQTLMINENMNTRFVFSPSQLFYNTTHVALFFLQAPPKPAVGPRLPTHVGSVPEAYTIGSLYTHGHFLLRENVNISQFQILLGSSCTPLFDQPLTTAEMFVATEEAMKKYNPLEMYGDLLFINNRLQEGDAFFLFDLTHARNSGFFIDADNMIRVEGVITTKEKLPQAAIVTQAPPPPEARLPATAGQVVSNNAATASRIGNAPPPASASTYPQPIHVMMMLIWQNTFTVLLDLDGAVLFQQK